MTQKTLTLSLQTHQSDFTAHPSGQEPVIITVFIYNHLEMERFHFFLIEACFKCNPHSVSVGGYIFYVNVVFFYTAGTAATRTQSIHE